MRPFDLEHLAQVLEPTRLEDYPLASDVQQNALIYRAEDLVDRDGDGDGERKSEGKSEGKSKVKGDGCGARQELYRAFSTGPGVVVVKGLMTDMAVLDRASGVFDQIITAEKQAGRGGGDHFAKPGANDRVWNSFEKHCLADPENFSRYYANPCLELVCQAWLGPAFQMTAQVNRVNPGGAAQSAHRDYHLGFMSEAQIRAYPPGVHQLSPMLTLQGAIAHVDMPLKAGPTMYLPHSQKWPEGYLYANRDAVQAFFNQNYSQLPLAKGDGAFFNPAVLHGAGNNLSANIYRLGNLLQVSSAMGRPMERVNRDAMAVALHDALSKADRPQDERARLIRMVADGYPFPGNLDRNPPVGGLAPQSDADRLIEKYGLG